MGCDDEDNDDSDGDEEDDAAKKTKQQEVEAARAAQEAAAGATKLSLHTPRRSVNILVDSGAAEEGGYAYQVRRLAGWLPSCSRLLLE